MLQEKKCVRSRCSVRSGTWFEESNMTLTQILIFTYMWLNKFKKDQIILELNISSTCYVKCDKFNRRICAASVHDDNTVEPEVMFNSAPVDS